MRRAVIAEHDRQTRHALSTNQSDLDLFAIGLNRNNGCESSFGEINGVDSPVGSFEILSQPEGHGFEVWRQQIEVVGRKGCEQSIAAAGHRALLTVQAGAQFSLSHRRLGAWSLGR
jgi:hypothetical protein